jgi:hypothetical protein
MQAGGRDIVMDTAHPRADPRHDSNYLDLLE